MSEVASDGVITSRRSVEAGESTVARLRGLSKSFGDASVLEGVDLDVRPGEFVVVVGPSGCGKTTLLRLLARLEQPSTGELEVDPSIAVGFQDARLLPWKRVWDNVTLGLGGSRAQRRRQAASVLDEVGLSEHADAWPHTLSGGQAQRASLARALTLRPRLLLLDEPFAAVDALTKLKMHALVRRIWREHRLAVVLVTHDVDEALVLADRILVLDHGRVTDEIVIDQPHPRDRDSAQFGHLRRRMLRDLHVEEYRE